MTLRPAAAIRVVEFSAEECPKAPNSGPPLFTHEQFHSLRNEILTVLSGYGIVGPNGKLRIRDSLELSDEMWSDDGNPQPDFYVISDIWNFWSRWVRLEALPSLIRPPVLEELAMGLSLFPGWCVYLALNRGGLTVFYNRLLFEGPMFTGSCSINDIYQRCASSES